MIYYVCCVCVAVLREKRYVALKVVKSELKYAEAAMDEIELLLKVGLHFVVGWWQFAACVFMCVCVCVCVCLCVYVCVCI